MNTYGCVECDEIFGELEAILKSGPGEECWGSRESETYLACPRCGSLEMEDVSLIPTPIDIDSIDLPSADGVHQH